MRTLKKILLFPFRLVLMLLNVLLDLFMLVICLGAGFLLCGKYGFALVGCLIGYGLALLRAYKSLDGMNGDISGYALTIGELCAVAVYALI